MKRIGTRLSGGIEAFERNDASTAVITISRSLFVDPVFTLKEYEVFDC